MAGINATYGPGTPLDISQENLWRGKGKTNGFLMRNVDGRVPALKQSFSRIDIGAGSVLNTLGVIPYGNGLWRDITRIDVDPGVVITDKPTKGILVGVAEFNQGLQTGHPVQNWGIPKFMRSDMINKGYIGYKVTMTGVGQEAHYLEYLKGNKTKDIDTVREVYSDWMSAYAQGDDGSRLALCFSNASGFPIMFVCADPKNIIDSLPASTTFGGFVEIFEPENEAVFISFGYVIPTTINVITTTAVATSEANGLMSALDKAKLDTIDENAEPNPGEASDTEAGLMSAADKIKLDGIVEATEDAPGLMSAADKIKLNTVEENAEPNPGEATEDAPGLMSAADKIKLNQL